MRASLIAVGDRMPSWVNDGFAEYVKRLTRELPLTLVEVSAKSRDPARAKDEEGRALLDAIPKNAHVVALDGRGQPLSSEELAKELGRWRMLGKDIAFLIGGADGLSAAVLQRADQRWSLGPLTLPHPLVRIVVAEQLYRAASQLSHHPYHRA
ncbi:MAG TPA: 23S rRNA (pseudouridine(1915)-N(3))-methyltransferase RlmH [Rudaea sp.]|jgi:23S rRNA (pseudouridine1915-N3)-methyltransferase|nr:23S rRNA (pseudouridine(1915)-N(3))-methyltransferase RlmH [Rudaea sp.]